MKTSVSIIHFTFNRYLIHTHNDEPEKIQLMNTSHLKINDLKKNQMNFPFRLPKGIDDSKILNLILKYQKTLIHRQHNFFAPKAACNMMVNRKP